METLSFGDHRAVAGEGSITVGAAVNSGAHEVQPGCGRFGRPACLPPSATRRLSRQGTVNRHAPSSRASRAVRVQLDLKIRGSTVRHAGNPPEFPGSRCELSFVPARRTSDEHDGGCRPSRGSLSRALPQARGRCRRGIERRIERCSSATTVGCMQRPTGSRASGHARALRARQHHGRFRRCPDRASRCRPWLKLRVRRPSDTSP